MDDSYGFRFLGKALAFQESFPTRRQDKVENVQLIIDICFVTRFPSSVKFSRVPFRKIHCMVLPMLNLRQKKMLKFN